MLVSPATCPPLATGQGLESGELWANGCELIGFGIQQGFALELKVDVAKESSSEDGAILRGTSQGRTEALGGFDEPPYEQLWLSTAESISGQLWC